MRRLIVSMNVTLDGYLSGPNCEMDWHFAIWSPDMASALGEQLSKVDTILMGRITYCAMASYMQLRARDTDVSRDDVPFIDMMNSHKKIVFSKTLKEATWNNSTIARGSMPNKIVQLKKEQGKDIIVYGSGQLVWDIIAHDLVDEYQLWVHPILLGNGRLLFNKVHCNHSLSLCETQVFSSGVVLLIYQTKKVEN
ncbi:MAG TPA: dihydrofolate reductase family protein [Flavipsychrobacter sp.]|nr:dihydrofolate reductase family protein [Flavipsychrobacter sp.]